MSKLQQENLQSIIPALLEWFFGFELAGELGKGTLQAAENNNTSHKEKMQKQSNFLPTSRRTKVRTEIE